MSLIKCKECGKEISTNANSCPHCGYVYKKEKTSVIKIVTITIITLIVIGVIIYSGLYIKKRAIPKAKEQNELEKYYGTWVLEEDLFNDLYIKNSGKVINDDYRAKKEIVINKDNIESEAGTWGCGLNMPEKDYAITTWDDMECKKDYYLITSLNKLVDFDSDELKEKYNKMMCFDLKNDKLIQRDCKDITHSIDNSNGIEYKRK